jgi:phosphate transport system protein
MDSRAQESHDARHFVEDLAALNVVLLDMARLAEFRVDQATEGLVTRDAAQLERVVTGDEEINRLQMEIDDRCFKLLALHQPMAVDLRQIVATVKINGDLERVGDLAVNVAEAARRYIRHEPVKPLVDLPRMSEVARGMLRDAITAFVTKDVALCRDILRRDDQVDALKDQIFRELLTYMLSDPPTIEPSLDLLLISRHLERVGDHATNLAEDIVFLVEARDVRHRGAEDQEP